MNELLKGSNFLYGINSANAAAVTEEIKHYEEGLELFSSRDDPLKQGLSVSSISNRRYALQK